MPEDRSKAMQRVGPLAGLPGLVSELGGDPDRLLREVGLARSEIHVDAQVPFAALLDLVGRAAEATDCEHFGLVLGARSDQTALGEVGRLMEVAPTLGDAILDFVSWQIGNSRGASAYLHRFGDGVIVGFGIYQRASAGSTQVYDLSMAVGCNVVRTLTRGRVSPREVQLTRRPPADRRLYEKILGAPVRFDQQQTGLVLSERDLAMPLETADPLRHQAIAAALREAFKDRFDVVGRLKHVLRPQLLLGHAGMSDVARLLQLHPRTLRRQLAAEGTTFEAIKAEVQFAVSCELLELTDLAIGDVAAALSFENHSAFDRAFRRWSGATPSEWRTAQRARMLAAATPKPLDAAAE